MTTTWHALVAALLLLTFATGCSHDRVHGPTGPAGDSIIGHDLALAPLHYVDAAGRVYELLLALGADGRVAGACYIVDGAVFASIALRPGGAEVDVQLYEENRAVFRAVVTPAARPPAGEPWSAFANATSETRTGLDAWQISASGVALGQLHAALSRLAAASATLVTQAGG